MHNLFRIKFRLFGCICFLKLWSNVGNQSCKSMFPGKTGPRKGKAENWNITVAEIEKALYKPKITGTALNIYLILFMHSCCL